MADDSGIQFSRQRLDTLLQRFALIGEGEIGALLVARLGDAPCDGTVIRHPHNEAAFPAQDAGRAASATPGTSLGSPDKTGGVIVSAMNHSLAARERPGHP